MQLSRVGPVRKADRAVAGAKGAAAEGGELSPLPGCTNNIRPTVAFAESYVLIVDFSFVVRSFLTGQKGDT